MQAAVDQLADRLQRSVVINDPAVHLLYATSHFGDEDPVRVQALLQRDAGTKAIGYILSQGVTRWTTAGVIPANDELAMNARVYVAIHWRGELLGLMMVVDAEGTLTTSELARINDVARQLGPIMAARSAADVDTEGLHETVLDPLSPDSMLSRRAIADIATSRVAQRFSIVTAVHFMVRSDADASSAHIKIALRNALAERYRPPAVNQLYAVTSTNALLLLGSSARIDTDVVREHSRQVLGRLRELSAGRFDCVAGVGPSVAGLDRAAETARQARLASRAAESLKHSRIAVWAELGAYGPLLLIPEQDLNKTALPEEIQRLILVDHDQRLTETMRAYLEHASAGPAASDALHIHRTTLYYRLSRITELTRPDLADGRTDWHCTSA